ncbi:MAG: PD-(D/E)XK nuclease family protein [Alphaproteobacteria bacterium]|jgi:ATP-dependent helicase/nuclease subunit B|nr:PD-(D/E)XK nuclease family protein [Alphaproteobacteria bacterium]
MGLIYNIPFGIDFCDFLADELLEKTNGDVIELSKYLVILPTSRSVRNLISAFSAKTTNMILPQIISLNMFDEESISILTNTDIPQSISDIKRCFVLSNFILEDSGFELNKSQSIKLAYELGSLMDKIETENLSIDNLDSIVPEDFSKHWQLTLDFIRNIYNFWEAYLEKENLISKAKQRNLILEKQSNIWKQENTDKNIIIAGFSSTIPSMLKLIKTVYSLKNGTIILQGLDRSLDFSNINEINYNFGNHEIINFLNIDKNEVKDLTSKLSKRQKLTSLSMLPANKITKWRDNHSLEKSLDNLFYAECENEQDEAEIISLILRYELEKKEQKVSLITPDRNLARCVTSKLERWGIMANDSSGQPLQYTPIANWLKIVLNMVCDNFSILSYLACMKHPFASCGQSKSLFKSSIKEAEVLFRTEKKFTLPEYILNSAGILKDKKEHSFKELIKAHVLFAEKLAASDEMSGDEIIWKGDFSEELANYIHEVFENSTNEKITLEEYAEVFTLLMSNQQVRKKYGFHPRLSILGLTESRLMTTNVTVLGGLNENIWPPEPDIDGWMSRPMKKDFGMSSPDKNIGTSAFDFCNAFNFDKVYLTRAKKSNTSINIKSRFLNRIEGVLNSKGLNIPIDKNWVKFEKELTKVDLIKPVKPCPRPKEEARLKGDISVTSIDMLTKDPYAFYAKTILKLYKLDELEEEVSAATKGNIIHKCLEEFIKKYPKDLPDNPKEELIEISKAIFKEKLGDSKYHSFWWPKFEKAITSFIKEEVKRRQEGYQNIATETKGNIVIDGANIIAKADRIDIGMNGVDIIDYKTGTLPYAKEIENLDYMQLSIEALIANNNGFNIAKIKDNVDKILIWSIKDEKKEFRKKDIDEEYLQQTLDKLKELIAKFKYGKEPFVAEPHDNKHLKYNKYEHLARLKLWRELDDEY